LDSYTAAKACHYSSRREFGAYLIGKLAAQISATVDQAACLESCRSAGAKVAWELGPGTSHMASALFPAGRPVLRDARHAISSFWANSVLARPQDEADVDQRLCPESVTGRGCLDSLKTRV
jgi:alkylation response protein AidB-like acyl-CoA dehydrogenase